MTFTALFLSTDVVTLFILYFQSLGISSDSHGFGNTVESDLATTLANSLRTFWNASHSVSHGCMYSGSSGDQEPDLLWKKALFSSSPQLAVHPLKRCGKRDLQQ